MPRLSHLNALGRTLLIKASTHCPFNLSAFGSPPALLILNSHLRISQLASNLLEPFQRTSFKILVTTFKLTFGFWVKLLRRWIWIRNGPFWETTHSWVTFWSKRRQISVSYKTWCWLWSISKIRKKCTGRPRANLGWGWRTMNGIPKEYKNWLITWRV